MNPALFRSLLAVTVIAGVAGCAGDPTPPPGEPAPPEGARGAFFFDCIGESAASLLDAGGVAVEEAVDRAFGACAVPFEAYVALLARQAGTTPEAIDRAGVRRVTAERFVAYFRETYI